MPDSTGPGVDVRGNPVVDPTKNVLNLVEAAIQRQDDLREAESRHVREIISIQSAHSASMRLAEAARIDAIRAVDVGAVQRDKEVSAQHASTLAAQVALSAEAVRVALAGAMEPIQKDIADLRRAQYEAQGVRTNVGETRDVKAESRLTVGMVVGVIGLLIALSTVFFMMVGIGVTIFIATQ